MKNDAYVFVEVFQGNINRIRVFIGEDAEEKSDFAFEDSTGVSWSEYFNRKNGHGEDDFIILGDNYAGTTIHVVNIE